MTEKTDRTEEFDPEEEAILERLRKMKSGSAVSALNQERMNVFARTFGILKEYAEKAGGKITWQIGDPYPSMGYIRITGKNLRFFGSGPFRAAAKLASNVDAYALANGHVCLDFTFHGMTTAGK